MFWNQDLDVYNVHWAHSAYSVIVLTLDLPLHLNKSVSVLCSPFKAKPLVLAQYAFTHEQIYICSIVHQYISTPDILIVNFFARSKVHFSQFAQEIALKSIKEHLKRLEIWWKMEI